MTIVYYIRILTEETAVLRTIFFSHPSKRIEKLFLPMFIDGDEYKNDPYINKTMVSIWNEKFVKHWNKDMLIPDDIRNKLLIPEDDIEAAKEKIKEISKLKIENERVRKAFVRWINVYYKKKPRVDDFDRLLSLSTSNDDEFRNSDPNAML